MPQRFEHDPRSKGDDGFSLVEAIVALAIATAVFTALAFALIGGAKSSLLSQQNQQAADVMNKAVEDARALPYQALALRPADLNVGEASGPSRAPTLSACLCYDPSDDTTSGAAAEPLVTDIHGGIATHVTQETQNGGTFTIRRYVTVPSDASGAVYKRLTVVVSWSSLGKERSRTYSTLVAESKRGLPLPDFKFTNAASLEQCRNPGSTVVFSFNVKNNGARDAWNLSTAPASPVWAFYEDTNGNDVYDAGVDVALANAGVPTTGLIEPTAAREFFGVLVLADGSTTPPPYSLTTVFRATSAAQPDYYQELTGVATVQSSACGAVASSPTPAPSTTAAPPTAPAQPAASCATLTGPAATTAPGGTMVRYYPYNPAQPGNTAASASMTMSRDGGSPPASSSLYNYSTDLHANAGRKLNAGGTESAADVATWFYNMPATSKLKGVGEVTVWAQPADGSLSASPVFRIRLDVVDAMGAVISTIGTLSYTTPAGGWQCAGMRPFSVQVPDTYSASGLTVEANQRLRLRVDVSVAPMRLGYGTAAYPMSVTLPYKSGLG